MILACDKISIESHYHCQKKIKRIYCDDVTDVNNQSEDSDVHWENNISISFHSEWDIIAVTVFEPNEISIWLKNRKVQKPFTVKLWKEMEI